MNLNLNSISRFALDIFYPNRCPCCNGFISYDKYICEDCIQSMQDPTDKLCKFCGLNFGYHVANILSERIKNEVIKYDIIVPIPMHIRKKLKRGYNQAEVIALEISKSLNVPIDKNALRVKYSSNIQHKLSKKDRILNANEIYYAGKSNLKDKYIILVDDIMTTGSTLNVCSNILYSMGAKSVIVAVATSDQLKT